MPHVHDAAVSRIAAAVKAFHALKIPYRINHGSTNSTRPHNACQKSIDISALSHVLSIDPNRKTATVEPNVPMDKLIETTLKHGLIPPVVMEFPGITVGGGYAGSAGESSSFRYGYFDQTVNSVEMVLADGEVVKASKDERVDLLKGAAGALGTLGITTLVELQLVQARKFVKIEYHRRSNMRDSIEKLKEEIKDEENDYVDGIVYSKDHGVVITGRLTDELPADMTPQTFSKPRDPWYYLHVQDKTPSSVSGPVVEYIPLAEYLFRYDRGGFWVGIEAFRYFPFVPFNKYTRWFLDDFIHTRMLYRALRGSRQEFGNIVQDLSLPYSTAEDFINYTADEIPIWPLWLCPLKEMTPPTFHPYTTLPADKNLEPKPMLNIGLWGKASSDLSTFIAQNRRLEAKLTELGGRKVLYSHTYYTEPEFWSLYDRGWYEKLREKYNATGLLTVYDKVKVDIVKAKEGLMAPWWKRWRSMWPFAGILGIRDAIRSRDYFLHRNAGWRYVEKKGSEKLLK